MEQTDWLDPVVSLAAKRAPEIVSIGEQNGSVLVIPVGSLEQHGAHLPVSTDTLLANAVATTAAKHTRDEAPVLVSPPVWPGYSPHHLAVGGTATTEFDTLHRLLEELSSSLLENGFDALLLVNGHGGNKAVISGAVSTIGRAQPQTEVLGITYFDLAASTIDRVRESEAGGMAHGGEFETALMLHLYPRLVNTEDMPATPLDEPYDLGPVDLTTPGTLSVYRPFDAYSSSGAIGKPDLATSKAGRRIFDGLVDELAQLLSEIHERNR